MRFILLILTIIAFSSTSFTQPVNTSKLDSFFNILSSRGLAMGSLTIAQNGVVKYKKAIGYSHIGAGQKIAADTNTKYRIGSVTKMFTAVMIFQLIEEGKLSPDKKLSGFFPTLPNADKITVTHMLSHSSGLHDYTRDTNFPDWMDKPKTHEELVKIIAEKGSDFEPGTRHDYSSSNYLLLGYIIEKIGKMSYADALKKRITSKLKLKSTYYGNGSSTIDNESSSYKNAENSWQKEKETSPGLHGGAGAAVSTPTDMVMFIEALFSNKLISKSNVLKMKTMVEDYGMGMFSNKYGSAKSLGHNGRIEEFYSALWFFPGEKLSFAYCTNGMIYPRVDIVEGILKICFNEPFTLPFSETADVKSPDLDKYLGKYSSGQIVVNCTKDGDKLLLETRGKIFETEKINNNYFMHAATGYFFEFYPEKGELQVKATDDIYYLKKIK